MTQEPSVSDLDAQLTTPDFLVDPYTVYRRLREREPVHWSEAWQCWLLTRYQDVAEAMRDFKQFSNVGIQQRFLDQLPPQAMPRIRPLYEHFSTGLTRTDPPRHTRIRALTAKALSLSVIESMRPSIEQVVDQLIDAKRGSGRIELIADFAYPLPGTVLADLFGLPHQDREQFQAWSKRIIAFHGTGRADQATVEHSQEALLEARSWLGKLIQERRRRPRQDLLTLLVEAEESGDRLTEAELFSSCVTFMIGGHETTTNLIGNGMLALLRNPDQLARLRRHPEGIVTAVEELLRYDAPVQRGHRIAVSDMQLNGKTICQGDFVQPVLAAANRDPAQFPNPDRLDIGRENNRHLCFGLGPHYCPGAALSRLEAQVAIPRLLSRLPGLHLAQETRIAWRPNNFFRGLQALPLAFDPV